MEEKVFVSKMNEIFQMANDLNIPIPDVVEQIIQEKNQ
jgi:hypothetical protein